MNLWKSGRIALSIIVIAFFAVNCVSLPVPASPVDVAAYKDKPQAEREKKYQENLIDSAGRGYKVNGQPVTSIQMEPLFSASYVSENTRALKTSQERWNTGATIFGVAGGGFIGWMVGLQLNGGLSKSTKENLGPSYFWAIGGGSLAVAIVFAVVASNKLTAASDSYNQDLYRALDLQQKTSYNPIPYQEQYVHHTVGWTFKL